MLDLSLIIFLLTLLLTFGVRIKKSYDDKRVSRELVLCLPSTLAGIFVGLTLVYDNRYSVLGEAYAYHPALSPLAFRELWLAYLLVVVFFGLFTLVGALWLGEQGASVGRALRDGGPSRVSNYNLFDEAESRLRKLMGRGEQGEATWRVRQLFDALPGDAQFEVLKGTYKVDWTEPFAEELANWLRGELTRLVSGEGEQVTEEDSYGRRDAMKRLGVQILPMLAQHPLLAEALRELESRLAEQASSLQQEVDEVTEAHATYTQKDGELKGITQRGQEISRLLGNEDSEESQEQ